MKKANEKAKILSKTLTTFLMTAILVCVAVFSFVFLTGCERDNSGWKDIAETVIAETSKADANFKITQDSQEIIIDGNKVCSNAHPFPKYAIKDESILYTYDLYGDVWYKSPQKDYYPSYSLWEICIKNDSILSVLDQTLNDLENVKYEGNGKYTYKFVSEFGPDVEGWNPVFEYTFITDGEKITEIEFRGAIYNITYGGQSIVLPNAIVPERLPSPQNVKITDGILLWDAVDGATDYYVVIYRGLDAWGSLYYRGAQTVQANSFDLFSRISSQDWMLNEWKTMGLQITVRANFPVFSYLYNSEESAPISYTYS